MGFYDEALEITERAIKRVIPDQAVKKAVSYTHLLQKPKISNNGKLLETEDDYKPKAPGMKYKHYAPKAEMMIFAN